MAETTDTAPTDRADPEAGTQPGAGAEDAVVRSPVPTAASSEALAEGEAAAAEVSFDAQFYPARPRSLRPRARRSGIFLDQRPPFEADGRNKAYVEWLRNQSMLGDADSLSRQLSRPGQHVAARLRLARPARRRRARLGVVHRLPAVLHHRPRHLLPGRPWARRTCGTPSAASASEPSTPGPSRAPAG